MKMEKPIIGINPYYFERRGGYWNATRETYSKAVWKAGGIPVSLSYPTHGGSVKEIAEKVDGLIGVGGPDVPIHIYHGRHPELIDDELMHVNRVAFDRQMFIEMKKLEKPILAICASFQLINIIYGGTLYEDIPTQLEGCIQHGTVDRNNGKFSTHKVQLLERSLLSKVMGTDTPLVSTTHHQGIRKLGAGLKSVGWSSDGLVEAIEDEQNPNLFLAVQWHPELMSESEENSRLFQWVVKNAGE